MTVNTLHRGGLTIETLWRGVSIADTSTPYLTQKNTVCITLIEIE